MMRPPPLAAWLLERLLDAGAGEALGGDLAEEFQVRAAAGGHRAAGRWYWRQALLAIVWRSRAAGRRRRAGSEHGATGRPQGDGESRRPPLMQGFTEDLRFALRTLRRAPASALTIVMTLALGIGAATTMATAAYRAVLRPLPFPAGDRLVFLGHPDDNDPQAVGNVGFATVVDWRARLSAFDELAIIRGWSPTLVEEGGAERLDGMKVSWNYFRMLGVRPALGRDFQAAEDNPERWRVVLLSDGLWRRRFGGRPDTIGSTLEFNGRRYEVAGVLPPSFEPLVSEHFYARAEIFAPLGYDLDGDSSCRTCQHLKLLGRLRPGATLEDARADLAVVHAGLRREHPSDYGAAAPAARGLADEVSAPLRRPLQVLLGAAAFVLLVACANVAGLQMARGADRRREIVVRTALGAGRGRLVRQLLAESSVLAVAGAVLGVLFARGCLQALAGYAPVTVPRLDRAAVDPMVVVVGVAVSAVALLAFALFPAWTSARPDLQSVLRESRLSGGRRAVHARDLLVAVEVAAALLLLTGAGLMLRTVDRLLHVDPGFDAHGVLSAGLSLVGPAWAEDAAVRAFQDELVARAGALPGVEGAALAGQIPLGNNYDRWGFRIEGRPLESDAELPSVERYGVTPGYFEVMRIPLLRGRLFDERDGTDDEPVMIIGETTASALWPGEDPLGQRVRIGGPNARWRTVVGVVGDVRHYALAEPPTTQMYAPQQQMTDSYLVLVVRARGEVDTLAATIRREITAIAADVPVYDVATLEQRMSASVAARRFLTQLLGVFALAAFVLASVGLYGVVSQAVAGRRREFGIRFALGAGRRDIVALVLAHGMKLAGAGIVVGLFGSLALGRVLASQLYETAPGDPLALLLSAALLVTVTALAHAVPLRRAARVDPCVALRDE